MHNEPTAEEIKADMVARSKEFAATGPQVFANQDADFADELLKLESRTKTNIVNVRIADGFNISVFASLSATDGRKFMQAGEKLSVVGKKIKESMMASLNGDTHAAEEEKEYDQLLQASDDYSYDMIEIVTANPAITTQYLKDNPDKFSVSDLTKILEGYQTASVESEAEAKTRKAATESFR